MLELLVLIICGLAHLYLSKRQERRHINEVNGLRRVAKRALQAKVVSMTQSRQICRQRAYNCRCLGQWELRKQRMSLIGDIMGPVDLYLEDELNIPAN